MTWDAVQGARRTEAEIAWVDTARLRAPQPRQPCRNVPKA